MITLSRQSKMGFIKILVAAFISMILFVGGGLYRIGYSQGFDRYLHYFQSSGFRVHGSWFRVHGSGLAEATESAFQAQNILEKDHPSAIPFFYEIYWIGIILLNVFLLGYFLFIYKRKTIPLFHSLTLLLFFLALTLYILEQGRVFTGYYDPVAGFISAYHETNSMEFLRFAYKLFAGIALGIYGFILFFSCKRKYKA